MSQGGNLESPPTTQASEVADGRPSYDSLFGQIRQAHQSSTGSIDFLKTCSDLVFGTLACTIMLGVFVAIPVSMITVGTIYLHSCPAQPYIPIYLIVGGVFGIFQNLLQSLTQYRRRNGISVATESAISSLMISFMFAWFIAGCIWIYKVYEPEYEDLSSAHYCNKTLYLFSFWLINSAFLFFGLVFVVLCSIGIVSIGKD